MSTAQEEAALTRVIMDWCEGTREFVKRLELVDPEWATLMFQGLEFIEADPRGETAEVVFDGLLKMMEAKVYQMDHDPEIAFGTSEAPKKKWWQRGR